MTPQRGPRSEVTDTVETTLGRVQATSLLIHVAGMPAPYINSEREAGLSWGRASSPKAARKRWAAGVRVARARGTIKEGKQLCSKPFLPCSEACYDARHSDVALREQTTVTLELERKEDLVG